MSDEISGEQGDIVRAYTEEDVKKYQLNLRGNGKVPNISVNAKNIAEGIHMSILACHRNGLRIETPKQRPGMTLGYDGSISIGISEPDSDPKICFPGIHDDARGLMQYVLEVTHGIHNHWKKTPENPDVWGYTYNERFVDQLPFIFQRIKHDWDKKKGEWPNGMGRPSGRDYHFVIWRPGEDIILEQEDAPCFQTGNIRLTLDEKGELVLNYLTTWRSRDQLKAWNENNIGQVELMKLFRDKISNTLGVPVKLGSYTDISTSLHLYGLYVDRDHLEDQIIKMRGYKDDNELLEKINGLEAIANLPDGGKSDLQKLMKVCPPLFSYFRDLHERSQVSGSSMSLDDYLGDKTALKRLIGAQSDYEAKTGNKNAADVTLKEAGYDLDTFAYPAEWDTWPRSWDAEPDPSKLARVP